MRHAFQHLEKHLNQTPTQYILQRFAGNDDQEAIDFKANQEEVTQSVLRICLSSFLSVVLCCLLSSLSSVLCFFFLL